MLIRADNQMNFRMSFWTIFRMKLGLRGLRQATMDVRAEPLARFLVNLEREEGCSQPLRAEDTSGDITGDHPPLT